MIDVPTKYNQIWRLSKTRRSHTVHQTVNKKIKKFQKGRLPGLNWIEETPLPNYRPQENWKKSIGVNFLCFRNFIWVIKNIYVFKAKNFYKHPVG